MRFLVGSRIQVIPLLLAIVLAGCGTDGDHPTPTPTPTFSPLPTATASATPTATHTATTTPTPTDTPTPSPSPTATARLPTVLVFNGETNRLNAYDPDQGLKQTVIPSHADDPVNGLDINGQICFFPDGSRRFIAGEDTNQPSPPPGWGIFQLAGDRIGNLSAVRLNRLVPTYQSADDNAENFGCGFLSDGRVLTTDIGNQALGPANGQLIVWFPPFDVPTPRYCKLDVEIPAAGGILVDAEDRVYVASPRAPAIFRYLPPFPTSDDAAGGCGQVDSTGAPLADAITRERFLGADAHLQTPNNIIETGRGTFYISSILNGVIAEYDTTGVFIRRILSPPPNTSPHYPTGTPLGIGVDRRGTLYFADLGLQVQNGIGPGRGLGSVRRIRFDANGDPLPPEIMDDVLNFPDGIGILEP